MFQGCSYSLAEEFMGDSRFFREMYEMGGFEVVDVGASVTKCSKHPCHIGSFAFASDKASRPYATNNPYCYIYYSSPHVDFSNSAFPSLMVAYRTVPDASVGTGGVVPVAPICLISSLILRSTTSWTAPGGLSAISLTSRSVRTSLRRDARDCRSSVVGPSKRRNS